jgi:replicative DNA helicase
MDRIESIILSGLTHHQEFSRKVLPFLKTEYFNTEEEKIIFGVIKDYIISYGNLPSVSALNVEIDKVVNINEKSFKELKSLVKSISVDVVNTKELSWLIDNTEKFCQDKALYNAIMDSIQIMEADKNSKSHKNLTKTAIPSVLTEALGITFNSRVGHDYFADSVKRFEHYQEKEEKIPFDIELLNTITDGGLPKKSLSVIVGSTGTGKSLVMGHMAANNLSDGKNVLYITLEMSEYATAKRIDANLFDVDIKNIGNMAKNDYGSHINALRKKTIGRLIVKEYPPASAHTGHFRYLLDELKMKEKFQPDIIYVDYVNLMLSMRMKMDGNSYSYIKAIAEELRGISVEFDLPVVSATQTNRGGYDNSEIDLSNVSESTGLAATADLMFAIIATEQLKGLGQIMIKQLKNRYNDMNNPSKFVIGVDKSKMKLYNLEALAQNSINVPGQQNVGPASKPPSFFGGTKNKFDSINI